MQTMARGHFAAGFGQALAVWLTVVVVVVLVRDATVAWAGFGAGVLACLLLGVRHQRHARSGSATGAFTGVVLWPFLIGVTVAVVNIVSLASSTAE